MARVQGIVPSLGERVLPERIRDHDGGDGQGEDDELEAWRRRREPPGAYTDVGRIG